MVTLLNIFIQNKGDASSDYSPNKLPHSSAKSVSPPFSQRTLIQQQQQQHRLTPSTSKLAKYQVPRYPEESVSRQQGHKLLLQRSSLPYIDHLTGDKKSDNKQYGKFAYLM